MVPTLKVFKINKFLFENKLSNFVIILMFLVIKYVLVIYCVRHVPHAGFMGCYALYKNYWFPTFRRNIPPLSSRIKEFFQDSVTLKDVGGMFLRTVGNK